MKKVKSDYNRFWTLIALDFLIVTCFMICFSKGGQADVVTDGSMGANQSLSGPDFVIPDTLGTTTGTNLFHSFQKFSITQDQSATFTGPDTIENVISRVTGGEISNIDGLLRSEVGQADFFFINPSGVVFGENARVDVPAAFHVSTADALNFEDGSVFSASSLDTSTLTMAPPESFGFLGAQSASIEINGALLEFQPGSQVSLTSGDITIKGTATQDTELVSEAGEIRLTAMGTTTGDVPIDGTLTTDFGGNLLMDSARVETSGNGGGHVLVQAGNVDMNASTIAADNTGNTFADGGVDMMVDGTLTVGHGSRVQSNVFGEGDSEGIRVHAKNLLIEQVANENLTGLYTIVEPEAIGNAGMIDINMLEDIQIQGVGGIVSTTYGAGGAGAVQVSAGDLFIDGEERSEPYRDGNWIAGISSQTDKISSGNANTVSITVENMLSLLNGCAIASYSSGSGNADSVIVNTGDLKIDGGVNGNATYIVSNALNDAEGNISTVTISASGLIEMIRGAQFYTKPSEEDDAGNVSINAGQLKIDGQGISTFTGITSNVSSEFEGNSGSIYISVDGLIELINGGELFIYTLSKGDAGSINVTAGEMTIDDQGSESVTGVVSNAYSGSEGNAGSVEITVDGLLQLLNGAEISSSTWSKGNAGSLHINTGEMILDGQGSQSHTHVQSNANSGSEGNAGSVEITVDGLLQLLNGASISSGTSSKGNAGSLIINAGEMIIDGQGSKSVTGVTTYASPDSEGSASIMEITVGGLLQLLNGALISSGTWSKKDSGNINIDAGEMIIDDKGYKNTTGVTSTAYSGSEGRAGLVEITVDGLLQLLDGALISSNTWSKGDGGSVSVIAGDMTIDDQGSESFTGISSQAATDSEGNAGIVKITVDGLFQLLDGGQISSSTWSKGDAGSVSVTAGEMIIDGQGSESLSGIFSTASTDSEGNAGSVEITVDGLLQLLNEGYISTSTWSKGDAGSLSVTTGEMIIDSQSSESATGIESSAQLGSEGKAGTVEITVDGLLQLINGALITTNTWAKGDAGSVSVAVGEMIIEGREYLSSIESVAGPGSEGNAGSVEITVDGLLQLINGAGIISSTFAKEDAGSVSVKAEDMIIEGFSVIASSAELGSEGNAGSVEITVDGLLQLINGAQISIRSKQTLSDTSIAEIPQNSITIITQNLNLDQGAKITAESTSNVPAGSINIQSNNILVENSSEITTSSNDADGGLITIQADGVFLNDGLITTSVEGLTGNGGDITITGLSNDGTIIPASALAMKGGFIQANTAATGASGGNIIINARAVVADTMGGLQVGGEERQEFQPGQYLNVIQAAAPGGEKGTINITAPKIDISGSLANVGTYFVKPAQLATNPCVTTTGQTASSLIQGGRGGIPETPDDLSSVSFMGHRLDQIFNEDN